MQFVRSFTEGCWAVFSFWQLRIKLLQKFVCWFCADMFSTPLGKYTGAGLLDFVIKPCWFYKTLPHSLPRWLCHVAFPPAMNEWGFPLLHILISTWCCLFWDLSHFNRCGVVSHYCSNLHFPDDIWCWVSFRMPSCCLCIFHEVVRSFTYFLVELFGFLLLSFKSCLYI